MHEDCVACAKAKSKSESRRLHSEMYLLDCEAFQKSLNQKWDILSNKNRRV